MKCGLCCLSSKKPIIKVNPINNSIVNTVSLLNLPKPIEFDNSTFKTSFCGKHINIE